MAGAAAAAAMLKALICLAVTVVCGLIGRAIASRYARREALLQEVCMALSALCDDISVKKLTLADAFAGCAKRYVLLDGLLGAAAESLERDPGLHISTAWERATAGLKEATEADKKAIAEAGGDIEALCTANDAARLTMRVTRMRETADAAHTAAQSKGKAYTCIGILTGIFISVLVY